MSGGGTRSGRRRTGSGVKMQVKVAATPTVAPAPVATPTPKPVSTPSGVTYEQFMAMSKKEKYKVMERIGRDKNIKVPNYLDSSVTSKIIYALGMNGKPEVVSDAEFDKRKGTTIYRTVNNAGRKMKASDIIKQIKTSDYTQMSNKGGSMRGRAIYFADSFSDSTVYSNSKSAQVMRAKIKPNAKIADYHNLSNLAARTNPLHNRKGFSVNDSYALTAIANGYDGWYDSNRGYTMIVNRSALVTAPTNKMARDYRGRYNYNWDKSDNA